MLTPRQLKGWCELYAHEDAADDRRMLTLLRVAHHADAKGYKSFCKTLDKEV